MYYLQSRYYDPQTSRWINSDESNVGLMNAVFVVGSMEIDMYCYCSNDCVNYDDNYGYFKIKISTAAAIVDGIILIVQIGLAIMSLKASLQMAKLIFKSAVKRTKKKLVGLIKDLIGSRYWKIVLKAVFGCVITVSVEIAEFIVELFLNMSLSYAILRAIYEFVPVSRKYLIL